jgi:ATP adenylyltransferase
MMNRFPYNSGHLMVAPLKHIGDLEDLTPQELLDLSTLVKKAVTLLRGAINPQGFNIGMNMGSIAGAGITDHLHVHVVPRWSGDTNFMPVVGKTKVLPESLANTYEKLSSALKALSRD